MSGARLVAEARLWIGTPYLHQASRRGVGCDCLGLLRGLWREMVGPEPEVVPPYSATWAEGTGQERLFEAASRWLVPVAPAEAPEAGEVLLFRMSEGRIANHLGLRSEIGAQGAFIHAYSGHGVVESALTPAWARRITARFRFG